MATVKGKASDQWRNERSREQLALGGLPLNAEWRLRTLKDNKCLFTSNLSVSELVLARAERILPLGQVTGSSVYHVGWQQTPIYSSAVLSTLSEAYNRVWRLALSRMQTEAQALGAHGVVGVRLDSKPSGGRGELLEVNVQGTAILWEGAAAPGLPFLSALTSQEFWSLLQAGYRPLGLAFGNCVYYQVTTAKRGSPRRAACSARPHVRIRN